MNGPIIDDNLFMESFEDFKKFLLPFIQKDREEQELPPLTEDEALDYYLDRL